MIQGPGVKEVDLFCHIRLFRLPENLTAYPLSIARSSIGAAQRPTGAGKTLMSLPHLDRSITGSESLHPRELHQIVQDLTGGW